VLQTAVNGLIAAIAGWRVVWVHLTQRSDDQAGREAGACPTLCRELQGRGSPRSDRQ
jgi:hypothetical protein